MILIPVAFLTWSGGRETQSPEIDYTAYRQQLDLGNIKAVTFQSPDNVMIGQFNQSVKIGTRDARKFTVRLPAGLSADESKRMFDRGVRIAAQEARPNFGSMLITILPYVLLTGFDLPPPRCRRAEQGVFLRQEQGQAAQRRHAEDHLADVTGADGAKVELQEIIEVSLKDPQKFTCCVAGLPKGALLAGPCRWPARRCWRRAWLVRAAGRPFFSMSGSDFVEMFVGVGASRVRDLFEQGKAHAPCIIFIDEIDAVGRHRGAGLGGGHDEREQTLNQLLVEMDGFESNDGVILIAATNRPDVLDPALLRPGRFDRQIVVDAPDLRGREGILKVHLRNKPQADDVSVHSLARGTPGMAGADLANLVNEGALLAARKGHDKIYMSDLEEAKDRVMLGAERKSLVLKDDERRLTAFHGGGARCLRDDDQGRIRSAAQSHDRAALCALGIASTLPEDDRVSVTREQLEARLVMAYGGRAAEEIVFGRDRVTTGAASDIQQATGIARRYVMQWGPSKSIGPILAGDNEQELFLVQ